MNDHARLVAIGTFRQPDEANMFRLRLDSEKIESHLEGEYTIATYPLISNAIGGVRVLVSERDAEVASHILEDHYRERAEADAKRAKTCPRCQSEAGLEVHRSPILGILAVLTLGIFCLLFPWPRYRCPECGHKWR